MTKNWCQRSTEKDRFVVSKISEWIRVIDWKWFVTLTFPWNVTHETAVTKLREFINQLERLVRSNVCYVAGQESKPRRDGINVPYHFHLVLAAHASLSKEAIETLWMRQVTNRPTQGRNAESVCVEPYSAHELGPEYCLKWINAAEGDWLFHRLEHFLPTAGGTAAPNHRTIRSAMRNQAQINRHKGTQAAKPEPSQAPLLPESEAGSRLRVGARELLVRPTA
jgi:hypothetical protein